jgi:hypothetical protein
MRSVCSVKKKNYLVVYVAKCENVMHWYEQLGRQLQKKKMHWWEDCTTVWFQVFAQIEPKMGK